MSKVLELLRFAQTAAGELIIADPFLGNTIAQIGTSVANHEFHQLGLPYTITIAYSGHAAVEGPILQVPTVQLPTVPPADVLAPSPAASAAAYPTG